MTRVTWTVEERPAGDAAVVRAVEAALLVGGRTGIELEVVFVSETQLTELHAAHLDDPTPTDVITFDLGEEGGGPAGELYVSVDRAREVAAELSVPVERELLLYVVHGTLHLCGYDDHDPDDARRMRAAEARALRELGLALDPERHDT